MIKIEASVGQGARNKARDVQIVQYQLLQLGHLSPSACVNEGIQQTIRKPLDELQSRMLNGDRDIGADFQAILNGETIIQDSSIPETIKAIRAFQRAQRFGSPDGRVDPKGGTEKSLNEEIKKLNERPSKPTEGSTSSGSTTTITSSEQVDLQIDQDRLQVTLQADGKSQTKILSLQSCRQFIISNYN